jgi:hypothetical protein
MAPIVLKSFELSIDIENFLNEFWIDKTFYQGFLVEKLLDVGVEIEEWQDSVDHPSRGKHRSVRSFHPSKISFPGLPSHAEVISYFIYFFLLLL